MKLPIPFSPFPWNKMSSKMIRVKSIGRQPSTEFIFNDFVITVNTFSRNLVRPPCTVLPFLRHFISGYYQVSNLPKIPINLFIVTSFKFPVTSAVNFQLLLVLGVLILNTLKEKKTIIYIFLILISCN